jgi:hypothetical protein
MADDLKFLFPFFTLKKTPPPHPKKGEIYNSVKLLAYLSDVIIL